MRNTLSPSVLLLHLVDRRRAGEQQHQVGLEHARDEHLLAVDDVAVALADRGGLELRRVGAGVRLGDAEGLQAQLAGGDLRQVLRRFCASVPCRSTVPMMYICAWQAPALPPERVDRLEDQPALDDAEAGAAVLLRESARPR